MLISKQNLAILPAASKHRENAYSLDCIRVDPIQKCLYASNSYSLYRSNISYLDKDEYPDTGSAGVDLPQPFMVPGKALLKAEKNIPGRPSKSILGNLIILSTDSHHELITTDLDSVDVVKVKNEELCFPAVEQVEKSCSDRLDFVSVGLSVAELKVLVQVLEKHDKTEIVRFSIKDQSSPAIIETSDGVLTGYIMPHVLEA
jgi:hypothetical protein